MPQVKALTAVNTGKGIKQKGEVFAVSELQRKNMKALGLVEDYKEKEEKSNRKTKEEKYVSKRNTK